MSAANRAAETERLCDAWVDAATPADGGLQIGHESEQYRLHANGIAFHDLNHEELWAACLGLTRVLLRPGLNAVIDFDHKLFWSWCAELFAGSAVTYFTEAEREPKDLLGLACRAALAGTFRPDKQGWEENRDRSMTMEANARELVTHAHEVLVYLAFPLLEAILRKTCSAYVTHDGMVTAAFDVPKLSGGRRPYAFGKRCSNLRDLLWLLYETVASPELVAGLDKQRAALSALDAATEPFDLLFTWPNSSLHGEGMLPTIGGTVFSTAILIALDAIRDEYDELREKVIERALQHRGVAASSSRPHSAALTLRSWHGIAFTRARNRAAYVEHDVADDQDQDQHRQDDQHETEHLRALDRTAASLVVLDADGPHGPSVPRPCANVNHELTHARGSAISSSSRRNPLFTGARRFVQTLAREAFGSPPRPLGVLRRRAYER
jgi:hypothetical protein